MTERAVWLDRIGATVSFLCAVHCALMPLVVATLPALGLFGDERVEQMALGFGVAFALWSAAWSWRRGRDLQVVSAFALALGLLVSGLIAGEEVWWGRALVIGGAVCVGLAHVYSARRMRLRAHDACCAPEASAARTR